MLMVVLKYFYWGDVSHYGTNLKMNYKQLQKNGDRKSQNDKLKNYPVSEWTQMLAVLI